MPIFICKDCNFEARDKWSLERHLNRKYGCSSIFIGSKEKDENGNTITVIKVDNLTDELKEIPEKIKKEYKIKKDAKNNKLEKI